MSKMNVKKWFNSPVLWAHITVFVFVIFYMMFDLDVFAAEGNYPSEGNDYTSISLNEGLGIAAGAYPKMNVGNMSNAYASATGGNYDNVRGQGAYRFGSIANSVQDRSTFVTSVTLNNTVVYFDDTCPYFNMLTKPDNNVWSVRLSGSGKFFLSGKSSRGNPYIVSNQPFVAGYVINYGSSVGAVGIVNINTADSTSGLYIWHPWGSDAYVPICNCPLYFSSTDGLSGYINENFSDFSFDNENFDFNNVTFQGMVLLPLNPNPLLKVMLNII